MTNDDVDFSKSKRETEQKSDSDFESKSNQNDSKISEIIFDSNFINAQRQKLMNIITTILKMQQREQKTPKSKSISSADSKTNPKQNSN